MKPQWVYIEVTYSVAPGSVNISYQYVMSYLQLRISYRPQPPPVSPASYLPLIVHSGSTELLPILSKWPRLLMPTTLSVHQTARFLLHLVSNCLSFKMSS